MFTQDLGNINNITGEQVSLLHLRTKAEQQYQQEKAAALQKPKEQTEQRYQQETKFAV